MIESKDGRDGVGGPAVGIAGRIVRRRMVPILLGAVLMTGAIIGLLRVLPVSYSAEMILDVGDYPILVNEEALPVRSHFRLVRSAPFREKVMARLQQDDPAANAGLRSYPYQVIPLISRFGQNLLLEAVADSPEQALRRLALWKDVYENEIPTYHAAYLEYRLAAAEEEEEEANAKDFSGTLAFSDPVVAEQGEHLAGQLVLVFILFVVILSGFFVLRDSARAGSLSG